MATHNRTSLTKPQLKEINNLARTLFETSEELGKLVTRRHPELEQTMFLIRQALTKLLSVAKTLDKDF